MAEKLQSHNTAGVRFRFSRPSCLWLFLPLGYRQYFSKQTAEMNKLLLHAKIIIAYVHLCDSILWFRKQSMLKGSNYLPCALFLTSLIPNHLGAYYFRKAWVNFRDAEALIEKKVEDHEKIIGLGLWGIGAFQFIVSLVPPQFSFLIKMLGFEGKRDVALKALETTSKSQSTKCTGPSKLRP